MIGHGLAFTVWKGCCEKYFKLEFLFINMRKNKIIFIGLEPILYKRQILNLLRLPFRQKGLNVRGLEPRTNKLPFIGLEPIIYKRQILNLLRLPFSQKGLKVRGLEPRTNRLKAYCSAIELYTKFFYFFSGWFTHSTIDPTIENNNIIPIKIKNKCFWVKRFKKRIESPPIIKSVENE